MTARRRVALALAAGVLLPWVALALDQPVAGRKLILTRARAGEERLVFVTKDPAFLFPIAGGDDDPATGTPGGVQVDLVTEQAGSATLVAPSGPGRPGWSVKPGTFKFVGDSAGDLRVVVLKEGQVLKVVARTAGVPLDGPLGAVSVRVTTGSLRSCTRFDGATIRKDESGLFVAKASDASSLADCSDGSLAGLPPCGDTEFPVCDGACPEDAVCSSRDFATCTCISSTSPCGDTAPVCNGTCAAGEECVVTSPLPPFNNCECQPVGLTLCGTSGFPTCGGECPAGSSGCGAFSSPTFGDYCACGGCGGGPPCPLGWTCGDFGTGAFCAPIQCGGTFPVCGGRCPSGLVCGAVTLADVGFSACLCGPPGPCDATCGGYECAPGEACVADVALTTCGCQ